MIDSTIVIVIGFLIIGFGLWWKWHYGWFLHFEHLQEQIRHIESKKMSNSEALTVSENVFLMYKNSFKWMPRVGYILGGSLIFIGFILKIIL